MRSVRKTFAWLPLWVLVLLVGGCSDEFGCKSMQGDVYVLLEDYSGEITLTCDARYVTWKSQGKKNHDFQKLPKEWSSSGKECYVFIIGATDLLSRRNFEAPVTVSWGEKEYKGNLVVPYFEDNGGQVRFDVWMDDKKLECLFVYEFWRSI